MVQKIKGDLAKTKIHRATTLKKGKVEKPKSKPKPKEKSLKVKSKKPSVKKSLRTRVQKTPSKKSSKPSASKSTKRVLIKKISSETHGRTLRSGVTLGKISSAAAQNKSPMTRSQKKRLNGKKTSTLVKSIKKG